MAKPRLPEPLATLERQLIAAMIAGLKIWRSDLDYPASYSDMQACARGLMKDFDVSLKLENDRFMVCYDGQSWCTTLDNPEYAAGKGWHYVQGGLSADVAEVLVLALCGELCWEFGDEQDEGDPASLVRLRRAAQPQGAPK